MRDSSKLNQKTQVSQFSQPLSESGSALLSESVQVKGSIRSFRRELRLDRVDAVIRSVSSAYRTFEYYQASIEPEGYS